MAIVTRLGAASLGVFAGREAVAVGLNRKQLTLFIERGLLVRDFPDTYRMAAVPTSNEQRIRSALCWAGDDAAAAGRSAGELFRVEGIIAPLPEIVVPRSSRPRAAGVIVHQSDDRAALMVREVRGVRATGIETTLVSLAYSLDAEALEVACEDARRRRLTSVPALNAYLTRFARPGKRGTVAMRRLLDALDPRHPSLSTLEVKTRRLLVANGFTEFRRELPLEWNGRIYRFDFAFERARTILETNGRRWHDDATDFERNNEKWSVPGRHGYRIVMATWDKVSRHPREFLQELAATFAA